MKYAQDTFYPNAFMGIGTSGWDIGAGLCARWIDQGLMTLDESSSAPQFRPLLCIETMSASSDATVRLRPDAPAVQVPIECQHVLPAVSARQASDTLLADHQTRALGERLKNVSDVSTEDGGGGVPLLAYGAAILDRNLARRVEGLILSLRELQALQDQMMKGRPVADLPRSKIVIGGAGGGSTFNGLVNYVAALAQQAAVQHRIPLDLYQIVLDPSIATVANGANPTIAQANFIMAMRLSLACVERWNEISFATFNGPVRLAGPLWKGIMPWSSGNGRVTCSQRSQVAASVSLAVNAMLGAYGAWSDGQFIDGQQAQASTRGRGPACLMRMGIWQALTRQDRSRRIAIDEAKRIVARDLLTAH